jgi:hypothetical protein
VGTEKARCTNRTMALPYGYLRIPGGIEMSYMDGNCTKTSYAVTAYGPYQVGWYL